MNPTKTADNIKSMKIRGAQEIAIAALKSFEEWIPAYKGSNFQKDLEKNAKILKSSRPSAVSLPNAIDFVLYVAKNSGNHGEMAKRIEKFRKEQEEATAKIAKIGAKRIENNDTILTHCNSRTVIDILKEAWNSGKKINVICTETRPWNQGLLTAKQLASIGIPVTLIVDSATRFAVEKLKVDKTLIGADTICVNGAVINKIGTSQVALISHESNVPVMVACQTLKFSLETITGELITIEERPHTEISAHPIKGVKILNPVFDATPPEYIDVMITEHGLISPHMAYEILRDYMGWKFADRKI